jgi:hypothetical protein
LPEGRAGLTLRLVATNPGDGGGETLESVEGDCLGPRRAGNLKAGSPEVSSGYRREGGVKDRLRDDPSSISTSAETVSAVARVGADLGDALVLLVLPRLLSGTSILSELVVAPSSAKPS